MPHRGKNTHHMAAVDHVKNVTEDRTLCRLSALLGMQTIVKHLRTD